MKNEILEHLEEDDRKYRDMIKALEDLIREDEILKKKLLGEFQ